MTELDDNILDKAVEQATNPMVTVPTELDAEALKPMEPISQDTRTLAEKLAAAPKQPATVPELNPDGSVKPKRRGRPPGSKNRSTLAREAQEGVRQAGPVRMVTPPARTKPSDSLTPEQRVQHKLERADQLATKVSETINDNMMLLLMSMGAPTALLYKPGREPTHAVNDSKYTDLAQSIMLGPMQTNMIGRFLAELEATDIGSKVGSQVSDGKAPLIIYGVLSAAALVQWGKSLTEAYKQFEPILTAYRESQNINQQHNRETGGSNVGQ